MNGEKVNGMKLVSVGAASFLTGTDIADALMRYAKELWARRRVDLVEIPVLSENGHAQQAQFLVGWANPVSTVSVHTQHEELRDQGVVDDLDSRGRVPSAVVSQVVDDAEIGYFDFDEL
jgi:hypothetical protein